MIIDFRSDTFTKPTSSMLEAMFNAKVGDDVFGEDPSVNELEKIAAEMFEMESAIFCASGTMTNQIGIKCHTQPGDEVICEKMSHVYVYEGGGIAFNSGCQTRPLEGKKGQISVEQINSVINPIDVHRPTSALVSLENTSNRGGGTCYNFDEILKIKALCIENGMKLHLDGARLFNALVAKNENPIQYGKTFDSISICLSKGLGAPVGSLLLGKKDFIYKARRIRKVLGGGMRQAGFLAAAGIYALQNNINRLNNDHENAKVLEKALKEKDFVGEIFPVETNILIFEVKNKFNGPTLQAFLKEKGILTLAISPNQIRMITHLDISNEMIDKTLEILKKI